MPCGKRIAFEPPGHTISFVPPSRQSARPASAAGFCIPLGGSPSFRAHRWHSIRGRASDDLLIQFAQRVSGAISDSDTVARLGGDEFTIILEGLSEPRGESRRVADKILTSLRRPFLLSGKEVQVTASLGLVLHETGGFDRADLLARADAAMYAAKHAGKNQVVAA
jgi:PleD family two-component response regulator